MLLEGWKNKLPTGWKQKLWVERAEHLLRAEGSADAQEGEVPAWRLESQRIVRSTDFKSYYPSLPIQRAAEMVKEMIER